MSIKLNGGSNPTSVTYNGSTVYKVMYRTSNTATPVAVWAKPFTVTVRLLGESTVSNYSSDVGFDSEGTRISNGSCSTGQYYAYYGDTFTVSWDDCWIPTVADPYLAYEAGSVYINVTSDVVIDPTSGGTVEPSANWITNYGIVDYQTYTITAAIQCPAMPPSTTTTEYNIAGKTGSHTGDVTSGTTVTNTFKPSITTEEFVCTIKYEGSSLKTEKISNPFYHSSGRPASPTITLVSASSTQIKYTVYNPNNHPILLEYGAEEEWGLDSVEVSAQSSKTFTESVSGNWAEIELCADACACGVWSGYTYLTVGNPDYKAPMQDPVLSLSFSEDVSTPGGSSSTDDEATFAITNNNNYAVTAHLTAIFHLNLTIQSTQTATVTVEANSTKYYGITGNSEYNSGVEGSCYFSATGVSNSGTVTATAGVIDDETT